MVDQRCPPGRFPDLRVSCAAPPLAHIAFALFPLTEIHCCLQFLISFPPREFIVPAAERQRSKACPCPETVFSAPHECGSCAFQGKFILNTVSSLLMEDHLEIVCCLLSHANSCCQFFGGSSQDLSPLTASVLSPSSSDYAAQSVTRTTGACTLLMAFHTWQ